VVFGGVMAIRLGFGAPILIGWFSDNPQVIAVASAYFLMVPISYGCYGLIMSVNATFNGMGKPMPAMIISVMRVLVVYLPLALLLQYFWALQGLFMATAVVNVLMGVIAYFWLMRDVKRLQLQA
jgi:Na+-driven multidrug efflux pump